MLLGLGRRDLESMGPVRLRWVLFVQDSADQGHRSIAEERADDEQPNEHPDAGLETDQGKHAERIAIEGRTHVAHEDLRRWPVPELEARRGSSKQPSCPSSTKGIALEKHKTHRAANQHCFLPGHPVDAVHEVEKID